MAGYLVIGLGTFGKSVAQTLYENGKMVLAIDQREERVQKVIDDVEFRRAYSLMEHSGTLEDDELFDTVTGLLADVAERYGASPEEMDTAIELQRAAADA